MPFNFGNLKVDTKKISAKSGGFDMGNLVIKSSREREIEKKNRIIEDSNAKAEKYYQEAQDIQDSFLYKTQENFARPVLGGIQAAGNALIGGTKAVGATLGDVLTPWDNKVTPSVTYNGVEYKTPGQKGVEGGQKLSQGKYKEGFGQVGEGVLDVAQFLPVGGAIARGASGASKAVTTMENLKALGSFQGLKTAGMSVLKNKSVQQNAALMGAYGVTGAMQENKGLGGIALEGAKGYGIGAGAGLAFEGAGSLIGRALTKLFKKIGAGPKVPVNPTVAKEAIDEITDIQGKPPTPEEENAVLDAFSDGATKDEIVTSIGKEKIVDGFEPKPRAAEVVDQLEANGEKLSLEEIDTVKKGLKEGKSIEEIQTSLRTPELPQKPAQEAPKSESGTNVPDNGDEAFLKSVEERFKASKTNKFREATKDEQGRFTGSKSEKKFKTGDEERDTLSQSIQNRMDVLKEGEEFKTTQTNFDDNSAFLKLEEIQNKIPKAKVEDLPALKKESDDITKELLEKRAEAFRPLIARDEKVRVVGNIAKMSDTFPEFRTNLKRSGYDEMKLFKNKESAETFFNQYTERAKYRVANEDPLLQEAKKYKSAEEFVNGTKDSIKKVPLTGNSRKYLSELFQVGDSNTYIGYKKTGKVSDVMRDVFDGAGKSTGKMRSETPEIDFRVFQKEDGFSAENAFIKAQRSGSGGITTLDELPKALKSQLTDLYNKAQGSKAEEMVTVYHASPDMPTKGNWRKGTMFADTEQNARYYAESHHTGDIKVQKVEIPASLVQKNKSNNIYNLKEEYPVNKAQGGKNRLSDDFERVTGQKITPEQEAKIIALNEKLFGDEDVKITAQLLTPEGQKAFGQYKNKVIKILDGQADATDTFYHEAVHKYLDLFTTVDEQKSIYLEARKLWKTDNLDDLEEKIAENFIRYAKSNEGVIGSLKVMFDKVIDRIRVALKNESSIESLYRDILEGKAKKGNEGYTLTSKEAAKREKEILSEMRKKESEIKSMKKGTLDEEKFLAREMNSTFIFDEEEQFNYQSFKNLLKRFKTGKSREELLSGDTGSIKRVLGEKLKPSELDHILYSQEKSEDEMLDYFRGIYEKDKIKVTNDDLAARAEQRLKSDPDYVKLQDELSSIKERKLALDKVERASLEEANKELQVLSAKEFIEPEIVPKTEGKKSKSIMAERLNKVLPDDFKIDENLDAIVIKEESEKAAQTIFRDKQEAIRRAFDPSVAPPERSAILQELAMIAERDGDLSTVSDLFSQRTYMARGGAQALNMEKASVEPKNTVEKPLVKKDEQAKQNKTISPIIKRLNENLDEANKLDENLDTTTHKKQLDIVEKKLTEDPKQAYNEAMYSDKPEAPLKTSLLGAFLEKAKGEMDIQAIKDIGLNLARHGRKVGQEVEMIKSMIEGNKTNKLLMDLIRTKLNNVKVKYGKIKDVDVVERKVSARAKRIQGESASSLKLKDAQQILDKIMCK